MPKTKRGLASDISDLVLLSGTPVTEYVGSAVIPTPMLSSDLEASSSVEVPFYDPALALLELTLFSQKFDAHIDGMRFRYLGLSKAGHNVTLRFEDEVIARLREMLGPKRAFRAKQTRANFICGLVEELEPEVPIYCPQRHEVQPIEGRKESKSAERQSKKEAEEAKQAGGKGIGDTQGLKVKGVAATPEQKENAETVLRVAVGLGAPFRVQVALMAAVIVETLIGTYGPGMSNILEAEGSSEGAEAGNAVTQVTNFLTGSGGYGEGGAIGVYAKHPEKTFWEIAQAMQRSGAGDATNGAANYGAVADEARQWAEAFGGGTEGELESTTSETVTEPFKFEVGKKETYWDAIQRLAKEVEWRAFVVDGRFFFISETELERGQVALAIVRQPGEATPETVGVIDVDFDYNANKPVTEVTVTALAHHWTPRPGNVVTLAGYGPASLGAGDAIPKEKVAFGISSAVKASTHEGCGRYLVSSVSSPLNGDADVRTVTIILVKPTLPVPEKLASQRTKSSSPRGSESPLTSSGMPKTIVEAIAEAERINAKEYAYSTPGARGAPPPANGPYDCSGVTSRIAYVVCGAPSESLASQALSTSFQAGEGEWFTIYAKGPDGPEGHAFCKLKTSSGWRYFATSSTNPGSGAGWVDASAYSASYLAEFQVRHPEGF